MKRSESSETLMQVLAPAGGKQLKPLAAGDFLSGSKPTMSSFAAVMKPLMTADVVGPRGQHVQQAQHPVMTPLRSIDSIPGVHAKGRPEALDPLVPSDYIPGTRAAKNDGDIEKQAQKWVAQTFFGTLLKQMHDSPFKSDIFSGGRGGKAFEPLMDQHLADHMTRGAGKKLVRGIVRQLAKKAYGKQDDLKQTTGAAESSGQDDSAKPASPFKNARTYVTPGLRG